MSASLVGSEMCIRDSPRAAPARGALRLGRARRRSSEGRRLSPNSEAWRVCLLYTSDAADDM
eukprot:10156034-Alexandrium_andersonii.AAC.1